MIRIASLYRWTADARFDHEYYRAVHMSLAGELLAPYGLVRLEREQLVSGPAVPGQIAVASGAYFYSLEAAQAALAHAGAILRADVANYTNIQPEIVMTDVTSHATQSDVAARGE